MDQKLEACKAISESYSILSVECMADLESSSELLTFEENCMLVKEGQYCDYAFYIIKGSARAYYLKDGKDISDWFAFENDFITPINTFFQNVPSPHFIELLEPSTLLQISKRNFTILSDKYHDFERFGRVVVTNTMLRLQQRITAILFETAQQKYENVLKIWPHITQRVALSHIASYLGITLETLSRIRNPKNRI